MSDEKQNKVPGHGEHSAGSEGSLPDRAKASSRARNQTVILTPEMTGQVRALLGKEEGQGGNSRDPLSDLLPPMSWDQNGADEGGAHGANGANGAKYGEDIHAEPVEPKNPTHRMSRPQPSVRSTTVATRSTPGFSVNRGVSGSGSQSAANPVVSSKPRTKIIGFFVSFDAQEAGEVFEIRRGRWLLTSRPSDHGDFILVNDESISPLHAIVRATDEGVIQVLDQLSEFGTSVTRMPDGHEEEVAGAMVNLGHGDVVRFGKRHFLVCLVPASAPKKE